MTPKPKPHTQTSEEQWLADKVLPLYLEWKEKGDQPDDFIPNELIEKFKRGEITIEELHRLIGDED